MADVDYTIGPWLKDAESGAWVPPKDTVGLLDWGSLIDCGQSDGTQRRVGLFCLPRGSQIASEYTLLASGDGREIAVDQRMSDAVYSLLAWRPQVGMTLAQALYLGMLDGDPTGQERWKLLVPERLPDGSTWLKIHLGGHSVIYQERFEWGKHAHTNRVRDLLRLDLDQHDKENKAEAKLLKDAEKQLRKKGKNSDADKLAARAAKVENHAEKVLDGICRKYGCDPSELSTTIKRGKAQTTITDPFSASLTGWTALSSTWATRDKGGGDYHIYKSGENYADEFVKNDTPLSASDYVARIVPYSGESAGAYAGPTMRTSAGINCYWMNFAGGYVKADKIVSGSKTNLGQTSGAGWTTGTTHEGEVSGSKISCRYKKVEKYYTDTAISSGLYAGFGCYLPGNYQVTDADGFYASDGIAEGPAGKPIYAYAQQ